MLDEKALEAAEGIVGATYVRQARDARRQRAGLARSLLAQRRLPDRGWAESDVAALLGELSALDSNRFPGNAGVGEREARVFSALVARRHFGMAHGVGRSGDLAAVQPKAAGSSLLYALANRLALDAVRSCGVRGAKAALVVPMATGMSVALVLLALRARRPAAATNVVWARVDQKSALKAVAAAGLTPVVAEGSSSGGSDEVRVDVEAVSAAIDRCGGPDAVLCVVSTLSCFAPRAPDDVAGIGRLCAERGVAHVVNNAYGLQAPRLAHLLDHAGTATRVDAFVQSTDKNFLVPVGGAIVASHDPAIVDAVSKTYPGRASAAPVVDIFATLLQMGRDGLSALLQSRAEMMPAFVARVQEIAVRHGERLLATPRNPISFAITMDRHTSAGDGKRFAGAMLFSRGCSGTRVWSKPAALAAGPKTICGIAFAGHGSHSPNYPHSYLSAACAIGITQRDVDLFCTRLDAVLTEYEHMHPEASQLPPPPPQPLTEEEESDKKK